MKKINNHIEIVVTNKHWLSSTSLKARAGIFKVLSETYSDVRITVISSVDDLELLVQRKPDLVFLGFKYITHDLLEGTHTGERTWLADYLDKHGITYTGSNHLAQSLELYKPFAKQRILDAGLKTSPFAVILQNEADEVHENTLIFPIFIKPTGGGGGLGVDTFSVVHNSKQLASKVQSISRKLRSDSLLEQYLPGREFSVAILKQADSHEYLVLPLEIVTLPNQGGDRILSHEVKSENNEITSVVEDPILYELLSQLAIDSFHALGARDYGRIDIRLDENGIPNFLEANLLPSLLENYGNFPKACLLYSNLEFREVILSITELGLSRSNAPAGFVPATAA